MTVPAPQDAAPAPPPPPRLPVRRGVFEPVVAQLTYRTLLGRRRALLLGLIPALMLILTLAIRRWGSINPEHSIAVLDGFGLTVVLPLVALIAGTTAIGPEVDDGSIVYLMAKPLSRYTIATTKFLVAAVVTTAFGAGAMLVAGFVLSSDADTRRIALAMTVAALVSGLAYVGLFLALAAVTRAAVVVGLIYVVVWEGLVGGLVTGAQQLSIHQWGLSVAEAVLGDRAGPLDVDWPVKLPLAVVLLVLVTVGGVLLTGRRLSTARLTTDE